MEKLLNRLIDLPSEVNGMLPWNCWNSCMSDSEGNLASWAGDVFRVGAFVTWVCSVYASVSIIWTGGMGEGAAIVGSILGVLLWVYAAFPIAMVVRGAGEEVAGSKGDTVTLLFHDLPMVTIKAVGYITALVAAFAAIVAAVSAVSTGFVDMTGGVDTAYMSNFDYAYALPGSAMDAFTNMVGLEWVGGVLNDFWAWDVSRAGDGSWAGDVLASAWGFVQVAVILAKLYVVMALYTFFWSVLNTLFNWVKSPFLPFRTK